MADTTSIDPTSLDTTDGLHAALTSAVDSYGNNTATPEQVSSLKSEISGLEGKEDKVLDAEIGNLEKSFDQKPPEQDSHVLSGLMPLLAISAFGGKAVGLNANAMLGSSIGMVQGYTQGKQEVYQDNLQKYNAAYERFKDQQTQIDKVYKTMLEAYGSRVDAKQKALQAAYEMTGNQVKNLQTLLQDHENVQHWSDQLKMEHDKMEQQGTFEKMKIGIEEKKYELQKQQMGANITFQAADLAADRILNGEKASDVLGNLGRGKQGAADVAMVQNLVAQKAQERGTSAEELATKKQELAAEARTRLELGAREGKIAPRVQEAKVFAQNALAASDKVPRTGWSDLNRLVQSGETRSGDPAMHAFLVYNNSLINAYSAAIGGGVQHVSDTEHARQMLSTADGPEAYKAAVGALLKETEGALQAPQQVMGGLRKPTEVAPSEAPAPSSSPQQQPTLDDLLRKYGGS